jgi:hypothetical protein
MTEKLVQEFQKLQRGLIVELHQRQVRHERWAIKSIHDLLDLSSIY